MFMIVTVDSSHIPVKRVKLNSRKKGGSVVVAILPSGMEVSYCTSGFS